MPQALVLIAFLSAAVNVAAEEPTTEAKEHYRKGTAAYNLGRYREAAQEYERAYELTLDPALLFNVGQAYRLAGDRQKAVIAYRSYLRSAPEGDRRAVAEAKLKELESALNFDDPFADEGTSGARSPRATPQAAQSPPAPERAAPEPAGRQPAPRAEPSFVAVPAPSPAPEPERPRIVTQRQDDRAAPDGVPLYQRWPFWAAVGGAIAAAVVVAVVVSSGSSAPKTDLGTMKF
jgi:tetratricopeptide (TPR) repeat protein